MQCRQCQRENREGAKFCKKCGVKQECTCPSCENSHHPDSRFCEECGHNLGAAVELPPTEPALDNKLDKIQRYLPRGLTEKILAQKDKIEGERKHVTVLFCEMAGLNTLSGELGAEAIYTIMDEVYEILIHKVHDYNGTVTR